MTTRNTGHVLFKRGNNIKTVYVNIDFKRIGVIDTMNEKFDAEVCIESRWIQKENIIRYNPDEHWNPKLYIENIVQLPKENKVKYDLTRNGNTINYT
jgi:hypothetical protein